MPVGGKRERSSREAGDHRIEITVARRLFVGNLSYRTSWQDLKDHFGQVGRVRYADVLREDGPGSRSKGCGLVEFETPEEAAAAITQLHDSELGGRPIWVREDREDFELRAETDRHGGGERGPAKRPYSGSGSGRSTRGGGGGGAGSVGRRVFVSNLAFETGWQELKDHFKQAGRVLHADILQDADGSSKGAGIVEFELAEDALHAISTLSNSTLGGRQIHVREDREGPAASLGAAQRAGGAPPRGGSSAAPGTKVVVHGLPYRTSWQELKDMCRPAGAVERADIVTGRDGTSKGWGVVAFATPGDAQAAISLLNGSSLEGRVVTAKLDEYA